MNSPRLLGRFIFICVLVQVFSLWGQTLEKITEGAKKEGKLKFGGTLRWEIAGKPSGKKIIDAFQARYPFVIVDFERVGGNRERERVLSELAAGKVTYDLTVLGDIHIATALRANVVERVDWRALGIDSSVVSAEGVGVDSHYGVFGIAYNTKLVPPQVGEKLTWEDCADPKWKGKSVMDDSPIHLETFWQPHVWGREKTLGYVHRLAANQTVIERSQDAVMQKMSLGEYAINCGNLHQNYFQYVVYHGSTTLGFVTPDPVPASSRGILYIPRGSAHPNAAKLWLVWLHSDEGQRTLDAADFSGSPRVSGTEGNKLAKGKKLVWRNPGWELKTAGIRKEIHKIFGLPVAQ